MAKKGGVQQLQADISSDDEFEKFLERPGLLILDIYSEWCGPCIGMVGSLRKIKLELGGDNLQLATCKAGSISYLSRFDKKSEPTWMFVANGKAINIMFGTDVPKLVALITKELELTLAKKPHQTYEITELQPIELEQLRIKNKAIELSEKIEEEESNKQRLEYSKYVTDTIMENLPDIGVTVFGPQVNRDMFKKLSEPADPLKLQCKDRKVFTITKSDFETVNFASLNPLPEDVREFLYDKELLMCFWKVDEAMGTPVNVLRQYAVELTKETIKPPDEFNEEESTIRPLISTIEVTVAIKIDTKDNLISEEESNTNLDTKQTRGENDEVQMQITDAATSKLIEIPPIWVPSDQRTHAALIYTYFRNQTLNFLPPDPLPEPPHIIMTFDAYKKKDLMQLVDTCKNDIPLYGFFTSDNPENAVFIANSVEKYNAKTYVPTDKIVLKVNKVKTPTIPLLMAYGPSYVSPNSVVGKKEANKFFPPSYKSVLQEQEELHADKSEKPKKRKKNKKAVEAEEAAKSEVNSKEKIQESEEVSKTSPEEGTSTTSSGEDSCESRPATADGTELIAETV